ncbi:AAA family ATPase [Fibrobacter sp. UWB10]|uniref:ATP-dependent DNA helicase n=1 Tax=Fibrobacter sp. UWB10 TaxID=1896201 RepID=UPI00240317A7|nr:AAA family ATPase [Fibrobacter sp. UWB10]SMP41720.1 exodeoxyribonuclease V alpha subunit [Fibrobacter sp. UWB10]
MDKNNENLMNALVECGAVTLLQKRLLDAIPEFCPDADSHLIDLLALLLCRQGRGDTRIPLDLDRLESRLLNTLENFAVPSNSAYMESLQSAVAKMNGGDYESVVGGGDSEESFFKKPFTLKDNYLYPSKYFYSKLVVEKRVRELFVAHSFDKSDVAKCIERVATFTKDSAGNPVRLEEAQAEAILRGVYENLIITGGPGTGKTTVIFFLLRELYCVHPELLEHPLYLAAPSGKAADRMKESIVSSMNLVCSEELENNFAVYDKIAKAETYTLHRLLGYLPNENKFFHDEDNPFPESAVFVIDESSMVDITLFGAFLKAIPRNAKIFLLGDADQLPPVDAGAVLGDLLGVKLNSTVMLTVSRRFNKNSEIGQLASLENVENRFAFKPISSWNPGDAQNAVQLLATSSEINRAEIDSLLKKWFEQYMLDFATLASQIDPKRECSPQDEESLLRQKVWDICTHSKILSAERQGVIGTDSINQYIEQFVEKQTFEKYRGKKVCKMLMLVKNQKTFRLYNGDMCVLCYDKFGESYVMFKKGNDFVFYPTYLFPKDVFELAYASTVHKAQGSEYDHVLMFLPTRPGHPLLNRQILYTGITRAKQSVTIIATPETFKSACETVIERDTGIEL